MADKHAPTCPVDMEPMKRDVRPMTFTHEGRSVTVDMPGWYCSRPGCEESLHTSEDMATSDSALARLRVAARLDRSRILKRKARFQTKAAALAIKMLEPYRRATQPRSGKGSRRDHRGGKRA